MSDIPNPDHQWILGEIRKDHVEPQTIGKYLTEEEQEEIDSMRKRFICVPDHPGIKDSVKIIQLYLKIAKLRKQVVELGGKYD